MKDLRDINDFDDTRRDPHDKTKSTSLELRSTLTDTSKKGFLSILGVSVHLFD